VYPTFTISLLSKSSRTFLRLGGPNYAKLSVYFKTYPAQSTLLIHQQFSIHNFCQQATPI